MNAKRLVATVLSIGMSSLSVGCMHTSLGEAPTDIDLRNDGADESRNHLYNKYKVVYEDGKFVRPYSVEYRADATSDTALNYVSTSSEAEDAMTTVPVALDRFVSTPAFEASLLGMGLGAGGALGVFLAVQSLQATDINDAVSADHVSESVLGVGWGISAGAIAGFVASVPLALITSMIARPLVRSVASVNYRSASKAFNKDLQVRIDSQTDANVQPPASNNDEVSGDVVQLEEQNEPVVLDDQPELLENEVQTIESSATAVTEAPSEEIIVESDTTEVLEAPVAVDERGEVVEPHPEG